MFVTLFLKNCSFQIVINYVYLLPIVKLDNEKFISKSYIHFIYCYCFRVDAVHYIFVFCFFLFSRERVTCFIKSTSYFNSKWSDQ